MSIIEACNVSKTYPAMSGKRALLGRGGLGALFRPARASRPALCSLSLTVAAGESVGIIGRNGSGKSTLLKLIAGVSAPTTGELAVRGRVASLLELGAGFHPMLTGRENVYLNAGLLGMRHGAVDACFDAIVAFSEIGDFIDRTVDTYSSGMYVRLAFSVAIHTNPDIFLVDEVLSVGDEAFQRKCRARIQELKAAGKTILFVSHDLGSVQALCDRVILLDRGEELSRGSASETITYYLRQIGEQSGICRLCRGETEALFNHGRIALYHRQREVTAAEGIKVQFRSMGAYHESSSGDWHVSACTGERLEATGTLPRLAVTIYLVVELHESGLVVNVTWENNQPVEVDYAALHCFLPGALTAWQYGAEHGIFPPITPADRQWTPVAVPRGDSWSCALHDDTGQVSPVCISLAEQGTRGRLQIDNTDYMSSARLVHVTEILPSGAGPLPPGRRSLGCMTIDPSQSLELVAARNEAVQAAQALAFGQGEARLLRGGIELRHGETVLTHGIRLHVQLRCGGFWLMSPDFLWEPAREEHGARIARGRTLRLPVQMTVRLWDDHGALGLRVTLECQSELALSECNVSLGLAPSYGAWATPQETGVFSDVEGYLDEWTCLNRRFEPGTWVRAEGEGVPSLTLSAIEAIDETLPCAFQTSPMQQASVIQLLCKAGQPGAYVLGEGTRRLFDVRIAIGTGA